MGKGRNRKPFIDKSKATTYNLLYRASEVAVEGEDVGPERELVEASRGVGIGRPDAEAAADAGSGGRLLPHHPAIMFQVGRDPSGPHRDIQQRIMPTHASGPALQTLPSKAAQGTADQADARCLGPTA